MSGTGAMLVCGQIRTLKGCTERESRLCEAFACSLLHSASSVIVGLRPAALFTFCLTAKNHIYMNYLEFREVLRTYRREFRVFGISIEMLGIQNNRVALFVWRPQLIEDLLNCSNICSFLKDLGYNTKNEQILMHQYAANLAAYYAARKQSRQDLSFPHEIGVVLGYPLEDVIGFMSGAQETCHGLWRVYGNEQEAKARFEKIRTTEKDCIKRYQLGYSLRELFPPSYMAKR